MAVPHRVSLLSIRRLFMSSSKLRWCGSRWWSDTKAKRMRWCLRLAWELRIIWIRWTDNYKWRSRDHTKIFICLINRINRDLTFTSSPKSWCLHLVLRTFQRFLIESDNRRAIRECKTTILIPHIIKWTTNSMGRHRSIRSKDRIISNKCILIKIPIKISRLSVMACRNLNHSQIITLIRVNSSSTNKDHTLRCLKVREILTLISLKRFINQVIPILSLSSWIPSRMPFSISYPWIQLIITKRLNPHHSSSSSSDPPFPLCFRWALSHSSWGPWLRKSMKTTSWQEG